MRGGRSEGGKDEQMGRGRDEGQRDAVCHIYSLHTEGKITAAHAFICLDLYLE